MRKAAQYLVIDKGASINLNWIATDYSIRGKWYNFKIYMQFDMEVSPNGRLKTRKAWKPVIAYMHEVGDGYVRGEVIGPALRVVEELCKKIQEDLTPEEIQSRMIEAIEHHQRNVIREQEEIIEKVAKLSLDSRP